MTNTPGDGGRLAVSWGAWTGRTIDLRVPAGWQIVPLAMADAPGLTAEQIDDALERTIDAPVLEVAARGKSRVVIAVDDITRPTRTAPVIAPVITRLTRCGIDLSAITVVIATGAHRAATDADINLKLGDWARRLRVVSHDPVNGVDPTDVTLAGTSVRVNRDFLNADLRMSIGGVMPHPFAGFSGGGKMVLPGLSDLDAVVRSHKYALMGFGGGLALEGNRFRIDMERAVRAIGLHWTVNVVSNSRCEPAAIVAGDMVAAHRVAADAARQIGATRAPGQLLDALVLNAFPKDSELLQVEASLVALRAGMATWLRPGAPVVLLAACPDGLGEHQLFGPGGRLFRTPVAKNYLAGHNVHVVSPATDADPSRAAFWAGYAYHRDWQQCVDALIPVLPPRAVVGYAGCGPLHVPVGAAAVHEPLASSGQAAGARA